MTNWNFHLQTGEKLKNANQKSDCQTVEHETKYMQSIISSFVSHVPISMMRVDVDGKAKCERKMLSHTGDCSVI